MKTILMCLNIDFDVTLTDKSYILDILSNVTIKNEMRIKS